MYSTEPFLAKVLDAVAANICVINPQGDILYVNQSWSDFNLANSCNSYQGTSDAYWSSQNYLNICKQSALSGDSQALQVLEGIQQVIKDKEAEFYYEYPCHSAIEEHWYMMRVKQIDTDSTPHIVIIHQDITQRKQ